MIALLLASMGLGVAGVVVVVPILRNDPFSRRRQASE